MRASDDSSAPPAVARGLEVAFAFLCLAGVAVSAELARIHVFVHTDPSYHSVCAVSAGINCETVALSPHAVFLNLPVAVWGIVGYMVMGAIALSGIQRRRPHPAWPWGLLLGLTVVSVLASAVLAYISIEQIASLCLFCVVSYVINAGLLTLALLAKRRSRAGAADLALLDGKAIVRRPLPGVGFAAAAMTVLLSLQLFFPRYWKAPGWNDLPLLPSDIDANGHHWTGATKPQLTVVEFSDYECPHCRKAHKEARLLVAQHADQVRLVHRHLPLDRACHPGMRGPFHERACSFAEAAECAGLQGRFWEMNDALFATQETTKSKDLDPMDLATRIGLDRARFKRCMEEHMVEKRIAHDIKEGMTLGLPGTPTFLIDGQILPGWLSEADLRQRLQRTP